MNDQLSSVISRITLLDKINRPLHDLRVSVIDRCNLRCPYCMPQESFGHSYQFLNSNQWLSFDEIEKLVRNFVDLGVRKIRITGGEPLLRPKLPDLIHRLKFIEGIEDLALTTNGVLLAPMAVQLKDAGLDRLTVSLDSLNENVYRQMCGQRSNLKDVLRAIDQAQKAGFDSLKINCVVQRGINDHTVIEMVKYFRQTPHILRFIEYMDVGNQNNWDYTKVVPTQELVRLIHKEFPLQLLERNYVGETSERFEFVDGIGEIGFVSSVTKAFCGTCNRLRLSADGKMYTCLFSAKGVDLRELLIAGADEKQLEELITNTWMRREDRYSQLRPQIRQSSTNRSKVEMFQVGG